jgi:hypothetical protein
MAEYIQIAGTLEAFVRMKPALTSALYIVVEKCFLEYYWGFYCLELYIVTGW